MTAGSITGCKAVYNEDDSNSARGGGVYMGSGCQLAMSGNARITGCEAARSGSGIYGTNDASYPWQVPLFTRSDNAQVDKGVSMDYALQVGSGAVDFKTVRMDGLGTEAYPYEIGTADQLKLFRQIVNGVQTDNQNAVLPPQNPAACAKLMNDIVLNDGTFDESGNYSSSLIGANPEEWTPIAYSGPFTENTTLYYTGTFDGQGHTIKGLYVSINNALSIEDQVCLGLFSTAKNAVIRNVTVTGYVSGYAGNLGGIAGYLSGGTIENCANYCTVKSTLAATEGPSYIGGIAGGADSNATIRDCYNTGTITVKKYLVWNSTGGIVGYNNSSEVSNCYNVGKVAGNGNYNGEIVGNNADDENGTPSIVSNCYYLDGTGLKAVGNGKGSITNAESKTAAELGDGTVLALLINGRADSEHPWNSQCQYLAAAGKTLPVFKTQIGDAHTHDWSAWTHMEGTETHRRSCTTCNAVETVRCSDGVATCTAKAVCAVCGAEYGDIDPNHHGGKLKHVEAKAATTREEGNIEYWYCEACNRYFSDANGDHEITQADTVIPKRQSSGGSSSSSYPITAPAKTENGSVTVSPKNASAGSTVTITVKPDSGYVLETISVTDKNGNDLKLTDKGNGKYTFTMPGSKVEVKVTFMEDNSVLNFFYDVPNDAYYYEAVKWAAENGITGGVGNSLFAPNQPCTRAQIVTFLWRVAGSPVVNYLMPFTDVDEGAYYAEAVRWAASTGIVTGLTETTFGTNDGCTRAQAAAMIYRYVQEQGKGFTGAWMFLLPFTDVPEWAYESVAWCYMNGVTTGVSETSFAPGKDCTRAQIVTFLLRAFSK